MLIKNGFKLRMNSDFFAGLWKPYTTKLKIKDLAAYDQVNYMAVNSEKDINN